MRTVLMGDIIAAARVILQAPSVCRKGLLNDMIRQTDAAHHFQKRLGKPHPTWGNGSLLARANCELQVREPYLSDIAYLHALQMVIGALISRRVGE